MPDIQTLNSKKLKSILMASVAGGLFSLCPLAAGSALAQAVEASQEEIVVAELSRAIEMIVVTGSAKAAKELGGSGQFLSDEVLETMKYTDVNRVLRQVPGVNIQDEDGFGLRPNIGLRGTGLDRSSKIAILEDGVLAAPAPYAAPSAYYFPSAGRMESIEVVKGPAGIKYGPLTTGGAINLFSTRIPDERSFNVEAAVGSDGYRHVHANLGKTYASEVGPDIGLSGEFYTIHSDGFKVLDSGGNTGFDLEDWVGKFSFATGPNVRIKQYFEFKAQYSDEISNETYLGLTDTDFAANPYRRYRGSQLDKMDAEHKTFQGSYRAQLNDFTDLSVIVYQTDFQRNWFKLDKVMGTRISSVLADPLANALEYEAIVGASGYVSADDAFAIKNNNRTYYAQGIQALASFDFETGGAAHRLEVSARFHKDEMDRFQWVDKFRMDDGHLVLTTEGVPGTESNRIETAEAWSFFVLDEIFWGGFTFSPGVRMELIDLKREDFGKTDPDRTGTSLSIRENDVEVVIPGVGVTYDVNGSLSLVGGVHKGFTNPGAGSSADAEESINIEFGARFYDRSNGLEVIGFFNDYSNLVGTCTASTGGGCTIGDQFDGGEVDVFGVEVMGLIDVGEKLGWAVSLPVRLAYTYTSTEFQNSFVSGYGPWGAVETGDEMPFIPPHQLNLGIGLAKDKWSIDLNINYVDEARASAGQGSIGSMDRIDDRVVVDASAEYQVTERLAVFATADNIFDETYVVSRTPAGLRPGKSQSFLVGLKGNF